MKPCPFCGSAPRKHITEDRYFFILCEKCGCHVAKRSPDTAEEFWNRRPIEDAQAARIAELEADVNRVKAESDIAWRSESKMTAECVRLRKALKEIAKLADSEYGKRIPAPSCVEFLTIKQYAKKALEGVENE